MAGINQGNEPSRKIRFKAHDLLVTTNRGIGGTEYKGLRKAFERLSGTRIETNIKTPPFYVSFQYLCAIVFVFRNVYVLFHKYAFLWVF
jgi:hypothetical protein